MRRWVFVSTPFSRPQCGRPCFDSGPASLHNPAGIEEYLDRIPALGYCLEADVIADAAAFLISDKARFITGCILPVSGGAELGYRQ
jgi:meso-butanediol dehydrogenase / (S,S)-butanediol dehydrogenase / diacetyl reductase